MACSAQQPRTAAAVRAAVYQLYWCQELHTACMDVALQHMDRTVPQKAAGWLTVAGPESGCISNLCGRQDVGSGSEAVASS
jgi:hypothetical protein